MLTMHLTVFLMRVSFAQNHRSDTCKYLGWGLKLARESNAQVTLRDLVLFCDALPHFTPVIYSDAARYDLDEGELYTLADRIIQQVNRCGETTSLKGKH